MKRTLAALLVLLAGCARPAVHSGSSGATLEQQRRVWELLQPIAERRGLDAGFVYALVRVESDFNPRAHRGDNRGLLQLKPALWKAVSREPYDPGVWDARLSLEVGCDVLAAMKARLTEKGVFSYPVLWACFHFGEEGVAAKGYDMGRIPRPSDPVAFRLWSGEIHPVAPPKS